MRPPPMITTDMEMRLSRPEARHDGLREEPHGTEHAVVGNLPAHVHPQGQGAIPKRLAELEEPCGDLVGRAVDHQFLEDLVVCHAPEARGLLASRTTPAE